MDNLRPDFQMGLDARLLFDRLMKAKVGDVITYTELSSIIGKSVQEVGYGSLATARKNVIKEKRMPFSTILKIGLKAMNDQEIVEKSVSSIRRIRKAAKKNFEELGLVKDYNSLNNESKIRHNAHASLFGAIHHVSKATSVKRLEGKVQIAHEKLSIERTLDLFAK